MKRSPSSPPPSVKSESREDTPCPPPPLTPRSKKAKKATTASPHTPHGKTSGDLDSAWKSTPGWTPEKKEAIKAKIIAAGIEVINKDELADEFNLTKAQIANGFKRGSKGNFREQLMKKADGSPAE